MYKIKKNTYIKECLENELLYKCIYKDMNLYTIIITSYYCKFNRLRGDLYVTK